ncbi:MAG: glycosyltransferase [Burkholderiaceae bacterium]|nr:glycosyltransferase [Burkholderiaceae bacterium]
MTPATPTATPDSQAELPAAEPAERGEPVAQAGVNSDLADAAAVTAVDTLSGSVDALEGLEVVGWARDLAAAAAPAVVDVLADGQLVATGLADLFRADLKSAGLGSGRHGFRIALPGVLCDGRPHVISVRAGAASLALPGGEFEFVQDSTVSGQVHGLEGAHVVGVVRDDAAPDQPLMLALYVDGDFAGQTPTGQRGPDGQRFALRVPVDAMDGRPHLLSVRVVEPFHLLGEFATVVPYYLTPDEALQRYAGAHIHAALLHDAAQRYESLRQQLLALAETSDGGEAIAQVARLRQLAAAHERVVQGFAQADRAATDWPRLDFPQVDKPDVSIVIPVHNKFAVTYHCLASLLLACNRASFEVVLVDDGSSDETTEITRIVGGMTCLRHDEAQGFVHSSNDGGRVARGRYVVMLNNDTEVTTGWLDEMVEVFDRFDGVGMVGAKLLYPNGRLQEAGGIVWGNGDPWNYGRNANPRDPRYNYTRQVDYLSGACIMLPRPLWEELGGFDPFFAPAYFEDTDLAFRVRDRGLKTVYAPFAQVIHFEGVSSGTSVSSGAKRYQEINKPKFKSRWTQAYRGNGAVGKDVELVKDRNVRFRALVIDLGSPQPDRDAGSYAAVQEMRLLQSLGFKLTFVPDNLAYLGSYTESLQRMGVECLFAPFVLHIDEFLQQRGAEFDLVYITRYLVAEKYADAVRKHAPQAKLLFNNADLHFLRELRTAIAFKSREVMEGALKTRDAELAVMRKVDLVLSYNEVEHAVILSHNLDSTRVAKCPWVVEIPQDRPGFEARRDIAFLGSFAHHPNIEAVEYFVKDVMPLLRERLPGTKLRVYGSGAGPRLLKLADDDVIIEGWVADVAEVYDSCRVFVAPLLTGAGIKGKVLGALAHGVPCVVSPIAAEGIGARDGLDISMASKPGQWVDSIAGLYSSPEDWRRRQANSVKFALDHYSFEKGQELMAAALGQVDIFTSQDDHILWPRQQAQR